MSKISERDLYLMYLPQIAELIVDCQQMTSQAYEQWKVETLESTPDEAEAVDFMEKVFVVTDKYSGHQISTSNERRSCINEKTIVTSIDIVLTGKRIHKAILDSGYSLREVKEMLCLKHPQPVYRWIHGYTLPSVDNLYGLSRILRVHMEDLLVERGTGDKVE